MYSSVRRPGYLLERESRKAYQDFALAIIHLVLLHHFPQGSTKEQVYIQLLLEWLIQCCYGVGVLIQGQRRGSLQQFLPWKVTPGEGGAPTLVWLRNLAHEVEYRTAFVDKNTATRACYAVLAIPQLGLMTYMREDLKPMKVIQNDLTLTEQMLLLL